MDPIHLPSRPRRAKPGVRAPDGPPQLTPIDKIIQLHHGSSTAIEATPARLQASKQYRTPSLMERIEQLQRRMSSLNHEIAYYREIEPLGREFRDDMERLSTALEKSLFKLGKKQRQIDHEWIQLRQG
jgi:uncharacterized protein (DUF342 family)